MSDLVTKLKSCEDALANAETERDMANQEIERLKHLQSWHMG